MNIYSDVSTVVSLLICLIVPLFFLLGLIMDS